MEHVLYMCSQPFFVLNGKLFLFCEYLGLQLLGECASYIHVDLPPPFLQVIKNWTMGETLVLTGSDVL